MAESGISLTEETNRVGTYGGTVSGVVEGFISAKVLLGTSLIAEITSYIEDDTNKWILEDDDRVFQNVYYVSGVVNNVSAGVAAVASDVWDEVLTGATHNIATSAGRRLRNIASSVIRNDIAQGPGTGNNQIQLDAGASTVDGAYDPSVIFIVDGTGVGQSRMILEYNGTTKTATVDRNWKVNPDTTSEFVIDGHPGREHVNEGLAQGGTINTITLNALGSSVDDVYVGQMVFIRSGTGEDQTALVTSYNGTTKVATIEPNWTTTPDTTSGYVMLPTTNVKLAPITHTGAVIPDMALATDLLTISGVINTILTDTNELQSDWKNGGRLDLLLDSILEDTSSSGVVISATTANQIADAILTRDWNSVTGEAARSALNALRILRNKVSESGGTLTVTEEDDVTTAWTSALTTSIGTEHIIESDPS